MAFDGMVLAAARAELEDKLTGGRIDKIHQPEKDELILAIRLPGENIKLLISAHAQNPRIHLTSQTKVNPMTPPLFCMVLRKHLEGGRITRLEQPNFERILRIHVEATDELGNLGEKILICEIMGKHSNIILLEPVSNIIIDSIRRVPHFISRHREVLPGRSYITPPEQEKLNPLQVEEDSFKKLIYASPLETRLDKALLKNITGLSPQTCREIVYRSNLPADNTLDCCGVYELQRLWEEFSKVASMAKLKEFEPTLVRDEKGNVLAFSAIDLTLMTGLPREHGTMNQLLDKFYLERHGEGLLSRQKNKLLRVINTELERNEKKLAIQEETLLAGEGTEKLRLWGELLTANLYKLEAGLEEARIANFYDPEEGEVIIPLDPQLTPAENAQYYFKKYNKARDSKSIILEQRDQTITEINYLESIVTSVEVGETLGELAEIQEELQLQGYLKEKTPTKAGRKKVKTEIKPLAFQSSDDLEVLVGKNNRQNDLLTLKLARAEDIWFHVKDIPGSHVILRKSANGQTPDRSLLEAAALAAYYSKARESGKVPVDYTLRKHVHKPNGAKPGMVIYENQHTVWVTPSSGIPAGRDQNDGE